MWPIGCGRIGPGKKQDSLMPLVGSCIFIKILSKKNWVRTYNDRMVLVALVKA